MKITVFTPTYNRGYIIDKLYQSLRNQTFKDFEWVVINDGSTDNTDELMNTYIATDNFFPIKYECVENGGKHRAVNKGVGMSEGELFFIVDSDDFLPENALEIIVEREKSIPDNEKKSFAGVCGLKGHYSGDILGKTFEGDFVDATYLETGKFNIHGDKAEVYYTNVIKNYPFPEFEGENFIPESTVWNRIGADGLKIRYFNDIIYYCEYLPDGLTRTNDKIKKYPKAYGLLIQQNIQYGKIKKYRKWENIYDYYIKTKDDNSVSQIAKNLNMKTIPLWLRMMGMRLFFKIYS